MSAGPPDSVCVIHLSAIGDCCHSLDIELTRRRDFNMSKNILTGQSMSTYSVPQ